MKPIPPRRVVSIEISISLECGHKITLQKLPDNYARFMICPDCVKSACDSLGAPTISGRPDIPIRLFPFPESVHFTHAFIVNSSNADSTHFRRFMNSRGQLSLYEEKPNRYLFFDDTDPIDKMHYKKMVGKVLEAHLLASNARFRALCDTYSKDHKVKFSVRSTRSLEGLWLTEEYKNRGYEYFAFWLIHTPHSDFCFDSVENYMKECGYFCLDRALNGLGFFDTSGSLDDFSRSTKQCGKKFGYQLIAGHSCSSVYRENICELW